MTTEDNKHNVRNIIKKSFLWCDRVFHFCKKTASSIFIFSKKSFLFCKNTSIHILQKRHIIKNAIINNFKKAIKNTNKSKTSIIIITISLAVLYIIYRYDYIVGFIFGLSEFSETGHVSADFGDKYGALNTLFSGIAFVLIILTILLQKKESKKTHDNLQCQIEIMNSQLRGENFMRRFDIINKSIQNLSFINTLDNNRLIEGYNVIVFLKKELTSIEYSLNNKTLPSYIISQKIYNYTTPLHSCIQLSGMLHNILLYIQNECLKKEQKEYNSIINFYFSPNVIFALLIIPMIDGILQKNISWSKKDHCNPLASCFHFDERDSSKKEIRTLLFDSISKFVEKNCIKTIEEVKNDIDSFQNTHN